MKSSQHDLIKYFVSEKGTLSKRKRLKIIIEAFASYVKFLVREGYINIQKLMGRTEKLSYEWFIAGVAGVLVGKSKVIMSAP